MCIRDRLFDRTKFVIVGLDELIAIPAPFSAELLSIVNLFIIALELFCIYIAPPYADAVLLESVILERFGLPPYRYRPPPFAVELLFKIIKLSRNRSELIEYTAPPY